MFNDHFKQKKYDQKFKNKIEWLRINFKYIVKEFENKYNIINIEIINVIPIFITKNPSIIKFYVNEYTIFTFDEFLDNLHNLTSKIKSYPCRTDQIN